MQHAQNKLYVRARVDVPDDVGRAIWNVEADDVGRRDGLNDTPPLMAERVQGIRGSARAKIKKWVKIWPQRAKILHKGAKILPNVLFLCKKRERNGNNIYLCIGNNAKQPINTTIWKKNLSRWQFFSTKLHQSRVWQKPSFRYWGR